MQEEMLTILALGAHADDLEISCAGTLARWAEQGHRVVMATMTWCQFGCYDRSLEQCSQIRHAEAAQAAAIIGAEYRALMFPDNEVNPYDEAQQRRVVELIRQVRPTLIVTHSPNDYHTDHTNVSELVKWAGPVLGIAQYEMGGEPLDYNPALFYMDTLNGHYFNPTAYVNITPAIKTKLNMVNCYQSQISYLKQYYDLDIIEQTQTQARYRGIQAGVRYAEAFQRHGGAGWGDLTRRYLP